MMSHHPRRHVGPQFVGLDLGIRLCISDTPTPMTRTREVGAWKKLANASERIPNIAVKARPLDRAYHFAVFKSHAASIPESFADLWGVGSALVVGHERTSYPSQIADAASSADKSSRDSKRF